MKDPLKFFPFTSYRKYQREVLERFYQDWNSTQVFLLEAPPGFGKSAVNLALSSAVDKALILCAQKVLLDQYERTFPNKIAVIKGRENYPCVAFKGHNCRNAPCYVRKHFKCPVEDDCVYKKKFELAKNSPITATTVAYGWKGGYHLLPRELIIVDEGHNIDTVTSNFVTFTVSRKFWEKVHKELGSSVPFSILERLGSAEELAEFLGLNLYPVITEYVNALQEKIEKIEMELDGKELVKAYKYLASLIEEAENKKENIQRFYLDVRKGHEWIIDKEYQNEELVTICARPLYVGRFLQERFWSKVDKIVISSATICSPKIFLKEVGLDNYIVKRYCIPSSFLRDRRPIYVSYCGRMGRKYKKDTLPKLADRIQEIFSSYREKVIVHSHSYENAQFLYEHLTGRVLFQGDDKREKMLEKFLQEPGPCIFLSVDMEEGIDLRDSLGRVNIIAKVPFPFLGDKKVKRRMSEPDGQEWYLWKTVLTLCQAYGRTTRSRDDWSATFILDSDFGFLFSRAKRLFPSWFIEALTKKDKWVRWDRCSLCKSKGKCVRVTNGWFLCKECWQVLIGR